MRRETALLLSLLAVAVLAGCRAHGARQEGPLRFWAMGREGEVVGELVRDFRREHPQIEVQVQQIPWSAAHEKLLTAYVGGSTPDLAQIGNTWIPEFAALRAIAPLDARLSASAELDSSLFFSGVWATNVLEGVTYGVPWYVDTRVLFYRRDLLARAGYDAMPETWEEWLASLHAVKRVVGEDRFAIFLPTNEWTQLVILALQSGSPLLADDWTRGAFREPAFRDAFDFYLGLYRSGLAPAVGNNEIANLYQEFERGYFAMYVTGPWNLGEFRTRLSPEMQATWATAPLPGPTGPASGVSLAGGSSLVLFQASRRKPEAWQLVEYLSRPEVQSRFFRLTGNLPARREAWADPALVGDSALAAFATQLERAVPTPQIPEWERVAARLVDAAEQASRGAASPEAVLEALDRDADRLLEKRRWLLARARNEAP